MKTFQFLTSVFTGNRRFSSVGRIPKEIEHLRRNCWIPVVEENDGSLTDSKFSGIPYLAHDETWPVCSNCGRPMQLFLQLNSGTLPDGCEKLWGEGLLQFFYCTNTESECESECEAFFPFSNSTLLRVINVTHNAVEYVESPVMNAFPPKRIVAWKEKDDFPNWEEREELQVDLPEEISEQIADTYPRPGEKLLGWPRWVQGIEYPDCPQCGERMRLVFQIDSSQSLPFDFGDVGRGHICQCTNHVDVLAFGWACS